jgi:hypothetical protein
MKIKTTYAPIVLLIAAIILTSIFIVLSLKHLLPMVIFAMTVMTARNNFLNSIRAIFFYSIPVYLMIISIRKLKLSNK